jgi:hypothetical protein
VSKGDRVPRQLSGNGAICCNCAPSSFPYPLGFSFFGVHSSRWPKGKRFAQNFAGAISAWLQCKWCNAQLTAVNYCGAQLTRFACFCCSFAVLSVVFAQ